MLNSECNQHCYHQAEEVNSPDQRGDISFLNFDSKGGELGTIDFVLPRIYTMNICEPHICIVASSLAAETSFCIYMDIDRV